MLAGFGAYVLRLGIFAIYMIFIDLPNYLVGGLFYAHKFILFGQTITIQPIIPQLYQNYIIIVVILFSVTIGGAVVGFLNIIFPPEKGDHGIPQVINAIENNQGRLPYKYALVGFLKSSVTIGTAGAAGREGSVVQIGGGVGSAVGGFFRVTPEEKKTLIMAGVAGGISATFNAPIGGLMFSFELFRRGDRSPRLLPLLVASVIGTAVIEIIIGQYPFLNFANYFTFTPNLRNFPYYIIMGAILGVISVIWIIGYHFIANIFERRKMNRITKPALGGFILGLIYILLLYLNILINNPQNLIQLPIWIEIPSNIGIQFPNYLSNALTAMNNQLLKYPTTIQSNEGIIAFIALTIFIVTFVGNGITLGSGGSGGQLAPTLLMGLMLGVVFEAIIVYLNAIGINIFKLNTGLILILAMAAFFAGSTRLPMTAIILTAEIVGDFKLTIPLMFTVATAWIVSRIIYKENLFSISLKDKGIISEADSPTEYLHDIPVKDIMTTNVVTVDPKDRAEQVIQLIHETGHNGFPVAENGKLVGIVTTRDFLIAMQSGKNINELIVSNCAVMDHVVSIVPECPVVTAIIIMNSRHINRLPVIEGGSSKKVVGIVTRADLNRASLKYGLTFKQNKFEDSIFDSDFIIQLDKEKSS